MKIKKKWILITDHTKGKIIEKEDVKLTLIAHTHHLEEVPVIKDEDIHKPGAVQAQAAGGRPFVHTHYSPHENLHNYEKHEFIRMMVDILNKHMDDFDELVLIGSDKALGDIKPLLHKKVMEKLTKEVHKDLMHHPIKDIEHLF